MTRAVVSVLGWSCRVCVSGVSGTMVGVVRRHHVSVAMGPLRDLKGLLVHPKDKQVREGAVECVCRVPCGNCEQTYVGETGRKFGVGLKEHKTELEAKSARVLTRSQHASSLTERNKSALTDHAVQENHVIDWREAKILDKESDRGTRWIKEAVHIRKEGRRSMNRDERSYTLSHVYDRVLTTAPPYRGKNRKKK